MDPSLYYLHLLDFLRIHGLPTDLESRNAKLDEEYHEYYLAVESGHQESIDSELADMLNVIMSIMLNRGLNPIWAAFSKLQEVAARDSYRQLAERVANGEPMKTGDHIIITEPNHPIWKKGATGVLVMPDGNDGWTVQFGPKMIFYVANEHFRVANNDAK